MKTIIIKENGGPEKLTLTETATPDIQTDEVLVAVKAIGINPVDASVRQNSGALQSILQPAPGQDTYILGWDISGTVVATGSAVTNFKNGDEVFGMVNFIGQGKAYAEYVAAPAVHLAKKPAGISYEAAAAATLAALTAWQSLVTNAKIKAGEKVLIHAAAGGVGHFAVQIAKHFGAWVAGTASAANKDFVLSLGADEHFDYRSAPYEKHFHHLDLVLDTLGGDNIDRSIEVLRPGGTIISLPSGLRETVGEKAAAKGRNGYFVTVASNGNDMQQLAALLASGIIKPHVSAVFPFEQMGKAHQQVESGSTRGKVVVTL